jgi:hypothetical protein
MGATTWFTLVSHSHFLPFLCCYNTSLLFCSPPIRHPFLLLSSNPLLSPFQLTSFICPRYVLTCVTHQRTRLEATPTRRDHIQHASSSDAWFRTSYTLCWICIGRRKPETPESSLLHVRVDPGFCPAFMHSCVDYAVYLPSSFLMLVNSLSTGRGSHLHRPVDTQVRRHLAVQPAWPLKQSVFLDGQFH